MKAKLLLALAVAFPFSASAVDMTWSGFGTLGFAQSNQPYPYLRFIDDGGTFKSDSLLGAQLDLKFDQHWEQPFRPSWRHQIAAIPSGKHFCHGPLFRGARLTIFWFGWASFGCR